jgi:hypothetical protein
MQSLTRIRIGFALYIWIRNETSVDPKYRFARKSDMISERFLLCLGRSNFFLLVLPPIIFIFLIKNCLFLQVCYPKFLRLESLLTDRLQFRR